ncbi:Ig-like domain-containing protein [Mycobacterium sp. shizuoka-1]|uniref:Ig-like domain-containing protein n=1 Tax=Mycobacterium sp. shizuoka-1 TaxID=2039281 RepID=UPI000C05F9E9|nr:Ig-like domain-containing protein [Mycobacterium sp. shizuoka-1]GAY13467.1 hypothetical protein MSZK_01930 [Mycobacterium sp. shizuoka-1]
MAGNTWQARVGAAAFMAGLSWVGLQTAGVAGAETDSAPSSSVSASHAKPASSVGRHAPSAARASARKPAAVSRPVERVRPPAVATSPRRPAASANPIQDLFDQVSLLVRRTFFNKPPTVKPIQITGEHDGVITGTVGAVDPEGDVIKYKVLPAGKDFDNQGQLVDRGPLYGTVEVASDGTFTYTPGPNFTGTDSFAVLATDVGPHINLLDLFRPASTQAAVEVNQYPIGTPLLRFSFAYDPQSESWWTPDARAALQAAANVLAAGIVVTSARPVTITYYVTVNSAPDDNHLATGGSPRFQTVGEVFTPVVVQKKILTGIDQNGSSADGTIWFNSAYAWSFDGTPTSAEHDFESVALHELVHTLGFTSTLGSQISAGSRTVMDNFIVDSTGEHMFASDGTWVKGGYGYFDGPNAVAANGGLVALANDGSHLDSFDFPTSVMSPGISAGARRIQLSSIEWGILQDLGYTIATAATVAV